MTAPLRLDAAALAALPDPAVDIAGFLESIAAAGDVVAYEHGGIDRVLVLDPAFVHSYLAEGGDASRDTPIFEAARGAVGDGLITTSNPRWRPRRLLLQRELSHRNVRRHLDTFAGNTAAMLDRWTEGARIDVQAEAGDLALRNLGDAIFATGFDDFRDLIFDAIGAMQVAVDAANRGTLTDAMIDARDAAAARLDELVQRLVDERRVEPVSGYDLFAVLEEALRHGDPAGAFTRSWLRDEAVTLIVAGHETTAFALTMACYLLARHPDVADALAREVDAAAARGVPDSDLADAVPFARHVLEETLRLYPPLPALHRIATSDLRVGGYDIVAGTMLVLSPWLLQRDARNWPQPLRFDPWRFAGERRRSLPRHSYLPFGAGPRLCAGNHFALLETAVAVSLLVRRHRLELVDPGEPDIAEAGTSIRLARGLPATVRLAERAAAGAA